MRDHEVIIQLINGEIKRSDLTYHQLEYWNRVSSTYDMMVDGQPNKIVMGMLREQFALSRVQAWRVIRETELIFSNMEKVSKIFHRNISAEMAKKSFAMAEKRGDVKAMVAATRAYNEATGLHIDSADTPDWSKIEPHTIIILPPQVKIPEKVNGGVIDLNEVIEEIAYEELIPPADTGSEDTN